MVLTPDGKIAQYYYGVEYAPKDLRLGLIQASQNKIGTLADQVLLYCYHYDPTTGKYGAIISRVLQLSATGDDTGFGNSDDRPDPFWIGHNSGARRVVTEQSKKRARVPGQTLKC